ncbi:hypothetical protein [Citrobacter koseri]|uniref:hypothetical protein n=1 Tax=Citrobacter koseri TaxID=545 RepID=UPI00066924BC|nr:hypothetical protein [Citrobacter koseri]MDE9578621.1 hypothetical protein [Citrobacter koseri]
MSWCEPDDIITIECDECSQSAWRAIDFEITGAINNMATANNASHAVIRLIRVRPCKTLPGVEVFARL